MIVGSSPVRVDAAGKVTGATKFAADLAADGMLHAKFVLSTEPHARIRAIRTDRARAAPGAIAVITAGDIPGRNQIGVIVRDQPCLAAETVRYVGDVIAVVVAETREAAGASARLVEVDYDPLPAIYGALEAARDESRVCTRLRVRKGDVAAGAGRADVIVQDELATGLQEHMYLEPMAALAIPDGRGGLTLQGSMQCPYYVQKAIADVTDLGLNRVRVIQAPTGGAFGGKEDTPSEIYSRVALAALLTGRPVKLVLDREEDFAITSKRHPFVMRYRIGARWTGDLVFVEATLVGAAGAYATLTPVVLYRATVHAAGPYRVPHVSIDTIGAYTNHAPSGAFRGFGAPQAAFGIESMMDLLADRLGRDPLDLRLQNLLRPGDETATGHRLENCEGLELCLRKVREMSSWDERRRERGTGRRRRGLGVAVVHYGNSLGAKGWYLDGAGAHVQLHRDGTVSVAIGHTDIGQGAFTALSQIAADAVGARLEDVRIEEVDTSRVPDSGPTVASRATVMSGNAILDAARKLHAGIAPVAAEALWCAPADVRFRDGAAWSPEGRRTLLSDVANRAFRQNVHLAADGWYSAPPSTYDPETGLGSHYFEYSYGAQVAEVEVDTLTGRAEAKRVWAAHDVGRAIYPQGIEAQVEGGVSQGLGYALYEEVKMRDGRLLNANFADYILPTAADSPEVETAIVEVPSAVGPLGARSLAEPTLIPLPSAVAGAVRHAAGIPVRQLPIRAEDTWRAMQKSPSASA